MQDASGGYASKNPPSLFVARLSLLKGCGEDSYCNSDRDILFSWTQSPILLVHRRQDFLHVHRCCDHVEIPSERSLLLFRHRCAQRNLSVHY